MEVDTVQQCRHLEAYAFQHLYKTHTMIYYNAAFSLTQELFCHLCRLRWPTQALNSSRIIHFHLLPHTYDLFSNRRRRSISYSSAFLFLFASSAVIFLPP